METVLLLGVCQTMLSDQECRVWARLPQHRGKSRSKLSTRIKELKRVARKVHWTGFRSSWARGCRSGGRGAAQVCGGRPLAVLPPAPAALGPVMGPATWRPRRRCTLRSPPWVGLDCGRSGAVRCGAPPAPGPAPAQARRGWRGWWGWRGRGDGSPLVLGVDGGFSALRILLFARLHPSQ